MIVGADAAAVIIVVAVLWVAIAAALAILAGRRIRAAQGVLGAARQLRALLEAAPARPLVVRPDGAIDIDPILQRDLGFAEAPLRLDQLEGEGVGLVPVDLYALKADLRTSTLDAKPLRRMVRLAASERVVEVRGAPAPPPAAHAKIFLFFF